VVILGRRNGLPCALLLGILRVGEHVYIGHSDGACGWTANLEAAGACEIEWRDTVRHQLVAIPLDPGPGEQRIATRPRRSVLPPSGVCEA
jgi:hypothetical protein